MILTENEAKTKWCPIALTSTNDKAKCISADCMMWSWSKDETQDETQWDYKKEMPTQTHGRCGLCYQNLTFRGGRMNELLENHPHLKEERAKTDKGKTESDLMNLLSIRESLSEYAHDAWSGWMKYMFSKMTINRDETATMPEWAVERWTRQMNLSYTELSEEEKDSDRDEAERMLSIAFR